MGTAYATIKNHRGLAYDWTGNNPILAAGEIGIETDSGKMKIGNGTSAWIALGYAPILSEPLTATNLHATTITATNISGATNIYAVTMTATNIAFGTYATSAAAVTVGYITITDAGGTERKLAII